MKIINIEKMLKEFPEIDRSNVLYDEELEKLFMKFIKKLLIERNKDEIPLSKRQ